MCFLPCFHGWICRSFNKLWACWIQKHTLSANEVCSKLWCFILDFPKHINYHLLSWDHKMRLLQEVLWLLLPFASPCTPMIAPVNHKVEWQVTFFVPKIIWMVLPEFMYMDKQIWFAFLFESPASLGHPWKTSLNIFDLQVFKKHPDRTSISLQVTERSQASRFLPS